MTRLPDAQPATPNAPVVAPLWLRDGPGGFAWWLWLLPIVLFAASTPLWLHVWEPAMFLAINGWAAPIPSQVWTNLSLLGNGWGVLAVTSPLLVLAPRYCWAWVCAAPFAVLFARTGKAMLEFPRPAAVVDNSQMRIVGELLHNVAMPSGHTLTAFAVGTGIFLAIPAAQRWRHVWLLVLAAGAGLSRIAVGAHWPGDVAVGASLGLLAGLLGNLLLQRMNPLHFQANSWSLRLVAVLVGISVYHLLTEALDFDENRPAQYVLAVVAVVSLAAFAVRTFQAKSGPSESRPGE
jgi:membrane-associated phospholipid phosphatase